MWIEYVLEEETPFVCDTLSKESRERVKARWLSESLIPGLEVFPLQDLGLKDVFSDVTVLFQRLCSGEIVDTISWLGMHGQLSFHNYLCSFTKSRVLGILTLVLNQFAFPNAIKELELRVRNARIYADDLYASFCGIKSLIHLKPLNGCAPDEHILYLFEDTLKALNEARDIADKLEFFLASEIVRENSFLSNAVDAVYWAVDGLFDQDMALSVVETLKQSLIRIIHEESTRG